LEKNAVIILNEITFRFLFFSTQGKKKNQRRKKYEDIFHIQNHILKIKPSNKKKKRKDLQEKRMEGAFFLENKVIMLIIASKIKRNKYNRRIKN